MVLPPASHYSISSIHCTIHLALLKKHHFEIGLSNCAAVHSYIIVFFSRRLSLRGLSPFVRPNGEIHLQLRESLNITIEDNFSLLTSKIPHAAVHELFKVEFPYQAEKEEKQ